MSQSRNQNSILVLATLGVYFGLVLVGAAPQVLGQAAMTRQFNVKDEVEVKDDLDTKPDNAAYQSGDPYSVELDRAVTRSVERFLTQFNTSRSIDSLCSLPGSIFEVTNIRSRPESSSEPDHPAGATGLDKILAVTNLPRGSLDSLFASFAK